MNEPLQWLPDGQPYSPRYGDVYRSRAAGLAQPQQVFLAGCGLPAAWAGQPAWTVLETGFGLGLNFLSTWAAWRADPQRCAELRYRAVEAHPAAAADLLRSVEALSAADAAGVALLATVRTLAAELAAAWAPLHAGVQTWVFEQGRVCLTLAVGEAQTALPLLDGPADAVYLDGFNPALNPAMWSEPTLGAMARLCRPGTRLGSWCVAGTVRARLRALGFEVHKRAGVPPKRHRLEAIYRG
jgi:tRNA 5-methylaminomethyl-2-thiouridine biosynthesis bifunctional protein